MPHRIPEVLALFCSVSLKIVKFTPLRLIGLVPTLSLKMGFLLSFVVLVLFSLCRLSGWKRLGDFLARYSVSKNKLPVATLLVLFDERPFTF